jgi:type IV pilus assembly protein PilO
MVARPQFLDTIAAAPRWQRLVIGLVALVAFGAAGYFIAVLPVAGRVASLRSQRDTQEQEIVRLRPMMAEVARLRRQAAEVERQLDVAKEKLPTEREIPTLYRTLSDAAVQAGLAVALFQPQAARVRDFYTEIPISVVAEGGYHELGDFLARVATLSRAAMVSDLKLTGAKPPTPAPATGATGGSVRPPAASSRPRTSIADTTRPRRSVRAEMTLLTYVYRPVGSPPAPKPAGAATKPDGAKP